jgi:uncharacterized membrane protein
MTADVSVSATIERPIDDVAAYVGDPSNAPEWYRRISSAEWLTEPPVGQGSRITFRARFMGSNLVYTYEVTDHVPGELLTMRTTEGPFPMSTTYTWRAADADATHMTLHNVGEPWGLSRLGAPIVERAMRRAMNGDLAELRRILQQG